MRLNVIYSTLAVLLELAITSDPYFLPSAGSAPENLAVERESQMHHLLHYALKNT